MSFGPVNQRVQGQRVSSAIPRQRRIGPFVFQTHYIKQLAELLPRGDVAEPAKECQIEVKFKLKDSSVVDDRASRFPFRHRRTILV